MLKNIIIENFKCFGEQPIEFAPMTVLVGANGGGKSTVIQSLLLASQLIEKQEQQKSLSDGSTDVLLNNVYMLQLGKAFSVFNNFTSDINFTLFDETNSSIRLNYTYDGKPDTHLLQGKVIQDIISKPYHELLGSVRYLHAERLGPRKALEMGPSTRINVGHQGEYVSHAIYTADERALKINNKLILNKESSKFSHHVENWMEFIFPSIKLKYQTVNNQNMVETSFSNIFTDQKYISPPNTGFGISYTLPIIVTGLLLSAEDSPVLIVENPEAHLHPLGQSRMGRFLAALTLAGVQVIVETHSEHVINGIRIFMAGSKNSENLIINYFSQDESGINIEKLNLKENGELTNWPIGFFDQEQDDLYELMQIKRGKV